MADNEQDELGVTTAIIDRSEFDAYLMLLGRVVVRPRHAQTPTLQPPVTNTAAHSGAGSTPSSLSRDR